MGAWVGPVLTGLTGLAGLFNKQKQTSTTKTDKTTMPEYDPLSKSFRDFLIDQFTKNVSNNMAFEQAYRTGGLNTIRRQSNDLYGSIEDILTSRGLGRTAAGAGTLRDTLYDSARRVADFTNNIPILMDQRLRENLASAGGFLSSLPVGSHVTGTDTTTGTAGPTSPAAGLFGGAAQGLAGYLGQWNANQQLGNLLKKTSLWKP